MISCGAALWQMDRMAPVDDRDLWHLRPVGRDKIQKVEDEAYMLHRMMFREYFPELPLPL